jgi:hypothetical protein
LSSSPLRGGLAALGTISGAVFALSALAGEPRRTIDASRALDAAAPAPLVPDVAVTPNVPDPPPLVERSQWVFDFRWDRGEVWLLAVHPLELAAPQATPRAMGRFALELFEGGVLMERVRFDFPLLGATQPDAGPSFAQKLRTRIGVVFPAVRRGTTLELWDRATGRRWSLPWPVRPAPDAPDASDSGRN